MLLHTTIKIVECRKHLVHISRPSWVAGCALNSVVCRYILGRCKDPVSCVPRSYKERFVRFDNRLSPSVQNPPISGFNHRKLDSSCDCISGGIWFQATLQSAVKRGTIIQHVDDALSKRNLRGSEVPQRWHYITFGI